jgi:23S rRNA (adenine2503-C2)-methyltransferase
MEKDLKNMTLPELEQLTAEFKQKPFLARYIFTFIHQKNCNSLDQFTTLSKPFRASLQQAGYFISALKTIQTFEDPDGTVKFVFELPDGCRIEAVRLLDDERNTFCISTQVGCRMGCLFCATGQLKYQRNLTAAEIAGQVYQMEQHCGKAQNLVYMGMGEPLDNYDQTMRSVELLNHPDGRNIGIRHITLSTCGLPDKIRKLAEESLLPRLAVSLHAPDDATRNKIMKIANKHSIRDIFTALYQYQQETKKRVTFEYCMIREINDSPQQARQLARLIHDLKCNVNLIEFNAFEGCDFQPATQAGIKHFAGILEREGIETVIRFKRGQSIRAACGQLGADWLSQGECEK